MAFEDTTASRVGEPEAQRKPEFWDSDWDFILEKLPDYPAAYFAFVAHPHRQGRLDPKTRELIFFATDAAPSHFYARGLREHGRRAMAEGATPAELTAVLAVVSTVGAQSFLLGASLLDEETPEIEPAGRPQRDARRIEEIRDRHIALLGTPVPEAERAIRADPEFYSLWLNLASVCFGLRSALTPKVAQLVGIAASAQCTQLSAAGVRQHVRAALVQGATRAEILEVCEVVSGLGVHALIMGVPHLTAEIAATAAAAAVPET